jgi:hypothetical protein
MKAAFAILLVAGLLILMGIVSGLALSNSELANPFSGKAGLEKALVETKKQEAIDQVDVKSYEVLTQEKTADELARMRAKTADDLARIQSDTAKRSALNQVEVEMARGMALLKQELAQNSVYLALGVVSIAAILLVFAVAVRIARVSRPAQWTAERKSAALQAAREQETLKRMEFQFQAQQQQMAELQQQQMVIQLQLVEALNVLKESQRKTEKAPRPHTPTIVVNPRGDGQGSGKGRYPRNPNS